MAAMSARVLTFELPGNFRSGDAPAKDRCHLLPYDRVLEDEDLLLLGHERAAFGNSPCMAVAASS